MIDTFIIWNQMFLVMCLPFSYRDCSYFYPLLQLLSKFLSAAFSMGETSPNSGPFEPNTLFLGGEAGSDTAMMFHKYDLQGITDSFSSI